MMTARRPDFRATVHRGLTPAGFTLVEMLVSVALVVLMMSMFATIFQIAAGSLGRQKGIAENDQRERLVDTIIRSDIDKRTFRNLEPYHRQTTGAIDEDGRAGYFHISEGNPLDDTDDILQFTVDATLRQRDSDDTNYSGRAMALVLPGQGTIAGVNGVYRNPNQPVFDDGRLNPGGVSDRASESPYAEVCYFLRRGVLYRRTLLIRNPLRRTPPAYFGQPSAELNGQGDDLIRGSMPTATTVGYDSSDLAAGQTTGSPAANGNFWNDFDFSAHFEPGAVGASVADEMLFHYRVGGDDSLSNSLASHKISLGVPNHRFGFNPRTGRPVSFASDGNFFGRFTHRETSHTNFSYPGQLGRGSDNQFGTADDTYPLARVQSTGTLETDGVIEIDGTRLDGPRAGEDVLLSNVLSFDVKIFDDHPDIRGFVDLGHATNVGGTLVGYYGHRANQLPSFGPIDISATPEGADGQFGIAGVDDDGDGTTDNATEQGWPGSDDPWNRCFDTWHPTMSNNSLFNSFPGQGAPFPTPKGVALKAYYSFGPDRQPGKMGIDDDGNGTVDDISELGWPGSDDEPYDLGLDGVPGIPGVDDNRDSRTDYLNPPTNTIPDFGELGLGGALSDDLKLTGRPLRAIQIRIRVRDVSTGQIRDITLQQSLLDARLK